MRLRARYILITLIVVVAILLVALCQWITWKHDYFEKRGICYVRLLDTHGENFEDIANRLYNAFPDEKVIGYFSIRDPVYLIRDPKLLQQLFVTDADFFMSHVKYFDARTDKYFDSSLFFRSGEEWRNMRKFMNKAFDHSRLEQLLGSIVVNAEAMTENLLRISDRQDGRVTCDPKDLFTRYISDVTANVLFSKKIDSMRDENNEFFPICQYFVNMVRPMAIIKLSLLSIFPRAMTALGFTILDPKVTNDYRDTVWNIINEREKYHIHSADMMGFLMKLRGIAALRNDPNSKNASFIEFDNETILSRHLSPQQWADEEIVAQSLQLFTAAAGPLSDLLSYIVFELAINSDIQVAVYAETLAVSKSLNGSPLNYAATEELKYMDQVISEALRKWPSILGLDRRCTKNYTLNLDGRRISFVEGDELVYPVYALHHDPKYFPNPEIFDPGRFSEENRTNIVDGTYVPFGVGPRTCIGKRLANMETKALLFHLILNLKFVTNERTDQTLRKSRSYIGLLAVDEIHVDIVRRHGN